MILNLMEGVNNMSTTITLVINESEEMALKEADLHKISLCGHSEAGKIKEHIDEPILQTLISKICCKLNERWK